MKARRTERLILVHNVGLSQGLAGLGVAGSKLSQPTNCDEGQQQTDRSNGSPNISLDEEVELGKIKNIFQGNSLTFLVNKNILL